MNGACATLMLTCALGVPALASAKADNNSELTRADVHADLIRVEQAGYRPGQSVDLNYPEDIQAAEKKIWADESASHMAPTASADGQK
ncbi:MULTISPECIES: DUF4148 domain-containing protein [Paraburkholderia]|uniref:DUF4148 domain-containing protein n=1 Tax=Paraburkholderia TaxID=1822464 RepID=UPI001CAD293A|nr:MULTISPECIES: DUF4148 domain-containing protein [Paraburkholderia]CAG9221542.1 exported hypothetical protein [Paraburkholderia caribensis]